MWVMLQATKISFWKSRYRITADDQVVIIWDGSSWKTGGAFELAGRRYQVRGNMWGNKYGMVDEAGTPVAAADRVGRKKWTVEAGGVTYEFRRVSIWKKDQELRSNGQRIGLIRKSSFWRSSAEADLPGIPLPVQIFVIAVVLTKWEQDAAAAAASGA